jgi:FkbH-like protein
MMRISRLKLVNNLEPEVSSKPPSEFHAITDSLITNYPKYPSEFVIQNPLASVLIVGTCNTDSIFFGSKSIFSRTNQLIWDSHVHNEIPNLDDLAIKPDIIYVQLSLRQIIDSISKPQDNPKSWIQAPEILFPVISDALITLLNKFLAYDKKTFLIFGSFLEPTLSLDGTNKPLFHPDSLSSRIRALNITYLEWCLDNDFAFLDVNEVASWIGRRHTLDDLSNGLMHGSTLSDDQYSDLTKRFITSHKLIEQYDAYPRILEYGVLNAQRIMQLYKERIVFHPIKLIILDLDETLWRGIHSEDSLSNIERTEGWPLGLLEALLIFKKSGGILAIASKNTEFETLVAFERIWKGKISISDFVSVKINHKPKSINIAEILNETNILPVNALFIDDNPREIDSVKHAIPEICTLNSEHYDWRRTILQNIEFFMNRGTHESRNRTELLQNKIQRDKSSVNFGNRHDWLKSLSMKSIVTKLRSETDTNFERVLELLNKTNQFNLNGDRISREALIDEMKDTDVLYFTLSDRLSDNGIVAALSIKDNAINRFVMSCRVFGLDFEYEILRKVLSMRKLDLVEVSFEFKDTDRNAAIQIFLKNISNPQFILDDCSAILVFEMNS